MLRFGYCLSFLGYSVRLREEVKNSTPYALRTKEDVSTQWGGKHLWMCHTATWKIEKPSNKHPTKDHPKPPSDQSDKLPTYAILPNFMRIANLEVWMPNPLTPRPRSLLSHNHLVPWNHDANVGCPSSPAPYPQGQFEFPGHEGLRRRASLNMCKSFFFSYVALPSMLHSSHIRFLNFGSCHYLWLNTWHYIQSK